jgi:hypothetical protein
MQELAKEFQRPSKVLDLSFFQFVANFTDAVLPVRFLGPHEVLFGRQGTDF